MSKRLDEPEDVLAASLTPRDYLLVRLNAAAQDRAVLPAQEGWRINNIAWKVPTITETLVAAAKAGA